MDRTVTILVCTNRRFSGASCGERGGEDLLRALQQRVAELPLACSALPCFGRCEEGANVRLAPGGPFFHHTQLSDVDAIVQAAQHFAEHLKSQS